MRYAILSDIHSNLAALKAVLEDVEDRGGVEEIWCLGDVIGYGPDPKECLELLRQHKHLCVAGNHDWAAVGKLDLSDFNPDAAAACRWTSSQLSPEEADYLKGLPLTLVRDDFTLVHGSPRQPIWEYLLSLQDARSNFNRFQTPFCLVGHSHVPLLFEHHREKDLCLLRELPQGEELALGGRRLIINPGAVGQPRNGDPRASYALYDSKEKALFRYGVPYDIQATQGRMLKYNLPLPLVARLSYGL